VSIYIYKSQDSTAMGSLKVGDVAYFVKHVFPWALLNGYQHE
jgi:hypothetical protein